MLKFGMGELIVILVIILILFGAQRLPEIGRALAKAIKEFKRAGREIEEDIKEGIKDDNSDKTR